MLALCSTRIKNEPSKWRGSPWMSLSHLAIAPLLGHWFQSHRELRFFFFPTLMTYSAFHLSIKSSSSKFTKFHYYLSIVTRYSWHNLFDCNLQTLLVDQSPEDVSRETTAPLPIRALGTRRPCLELKSVRLRGKAASGDPEVPREATSPRHLMCPHSLTRNNSSLGENQVRRGVGCK